VVAGSAPDKPAQPAVLRQQGARGREVVSHWNHSNGRRGCFAAGPHRPTAINLGGDRGRPKNGWRAARVPPLATAARKPSVGSMMRGVGKLSGIGSAGAPGMMPTMDRPAATLGVWCRLAGAATRCVARRVRKGAGQAFGNLPGKSHSARNGGPLDIAPDGPRKGDASPRLPHGNCKSAGSTLRRAAKAVIESYRQPSRQRAGSRGWTMATIEIENRRSKAGGHDLLLPSRPRSRMNVPRQVRSAAGRA